MSAGSKYRRSPTDGLLCRESGEWAKEKLHYLAAYMFIFNQGMKNRWPKRGYIDLMAGPGRCILTESNDEFDGSPLRALQCSPEFTSVVLVESSPKLRVVLEQRVSAFGDRVRVISGDCNADKTIAEIRERIPAGALTLAFADMLGLEVEFETLRRLTHDRKVDLAITFQVSDLVRNVPLILQGAADGARLDRFFGTREWRRVVAETEGGKLPTSDIGNALTDFYIQQLSKLGYAHVQPLHRLMKNTQNTPLYRLVLAGKHERAVEFFNKISKYEYSGQRGLPLES